MRPAPLTQRHRQPQHTRRWSQTRQESNPRRVVMRGLFQSAMCVAALGQTSTREMCVTFTESRGGLDASLGAASPDTACDGNMCRKHSGVVMSEAHLFSGTICSNEPKDCNGTYSGCQYSDGMRLCAALPLSPQQHFHWPPI